MTDHEVNDCNTLNEFLEAIVNLCDQHMVTGIAVVLSIQNGQRITSHQFGMDNNELAISSSLMADYAKGLIVDHVEN